MQPGLPGGFPRGSASFRVIMNVPVLTMPSTIPELKAVKAFLSLYSK